MEIIILCSLLIAGVILLLVELFLLPGSTIAGIGSVLSFGGGIYYAFSIYGTPIGILVVVLSVLFTAYSIFRFMRSKTLDAISLHATIDGKTNVMEGFTVSVGDEGVAISRLAPMGKIQINGHTIEVKVIADMIDTGTKVKVTEVSSSGIVVARTE